MDKHLSIEEYLDEHDTLTYANVGVSMMPLLRQGKDLFTVRKKGHERYKAGDVVLYRTSSRYVLHRVIETRPEDYVILGDNCTVKEYGIKDADILGVMIAFVRNGREYSVSDWRYRLYSFIILHTIALRVFLKKNRIRLARWFKRQG